MQTASIYFVIMQCQKVFETNHIFKIALIYQINEWTSKMAFVLEYN